MRSTALLMLLCYVGCSSSATTMQDGEPVGKLLYKKSPVAQVQVGFHDPATKERRAFGVTDPEGQFRLFQQEGQPHLLPAGPYLVTTENIGEATWAFPSKYHDPAKTPLKIEVVAGQSIEIAVP